MREFLLAFIMICPLMSFAQNPRDMNGGFYDYKVGDRIECPELVHRLEGGQRLVINDKTNSKDSLRMIADFLKKHHNLVVEVRSHTDCRGHKDYNRDLTERRAQMVTQLLTEWFKINPSRIKPKGMGESEPFMACEKIAALETQEEQEKEHLKNRRYDLKVIRTNRFDTARALHPKSLSCDSVGVGDYLQIPEILFGFDQADLQVNERTNSQDSLDLLVEWLVYHPNLLIEVQNHCDTRWSDKYSYRLQHARAESVRDYLISKGISPDRVIAKGYDDHQPLIPQEAIDALSTDQEKEAAHSINRRTVVLIIADNYTTE